MKIPNFFSVAYGGRCAWIALAILVATPICSFSATVTQITTEARERGLREIDAALKAEPGLVRPIEPERLFDNKPLTLEKVVALALSNDKNLKQQRDQLILCATDVQKTRRTYLPVFRGSVSGGYNETVYMRDASHEADRRTASEQSVGISQKVPGGGSLNVDVGGGLSQQPDENWAYAGRMNASLNIPILRGSGMDYYYEALLSGKRGLVYQLRNYRQQRDRVTLDTVEAFLQCTKLQASLRNSREKLKTFETLENRAKVLWQIGQESEFEVLRTRQLVLSTNDEIRDMETQIANTLESLKIRLGVPPSGKLEFVESALPDHLFPMTAEETVSAALRGRLDLKTAQEVVSDRNRDTRYAQRDMLPALDLNLHAGGWNDNLQGSGTPTRDTGASIKMEFPFDRTNERSRLYSSAFSLIQSQRDLENATDTVVADIRNGVRNVRNVEQTLQTVAAILQIEQRRFDIANANYERGLVTNRDVLEASAGLSDVQNWQRELQNQRFVGVLRLENDAGLFNTDVFLQQMTQPETRS